MKVAVVGGGIVGLSTGRFLAQRGHTVTLYERFPMFHDHGSSHGSSRIVRRAYADPFYTQCMAEAYPLWAELEAESGTKLIEECGLFYFGNADAPRVEGVRQGLEDLHVPHQLMNQAEASKLLPIVKVEKSEVAIYTPEAGWVNAEEALRATLKVAESHGLKVERREAHFPDLEAHFDAVVIAPGAWIKEFVPVDVRVTLQTFGYVGKRISGPVWIDDESLTYGVPNDPNGFKIGAHSPGPEVSPNFGDRSPCGSHLLEIECVAWSRFGRDGAITGGKTCLYTSTPDEDFRIGRIGTKGVFASACSGHGFKMGPWTGRILADIVEGKDTPENHPRFAWPRDVG